QTPAVSHRDDLWQCSGAGSPEGPRHLLRGADDRLLASRASVARQLYVGEARRLGTSGYSSPQKSRFRSRIVSTLYLCKHRFDVSRGKIVPRRRADRVQFFAYLARWLAAPRQLQRLPHPLSDGHMARTSHALDFPVFQVVKDYLKPLSHIMSLSD